jgi:hypothetical protein
MESVRAAVLLQRDENADIEQFKFRKNKKFDIFIEGNVIQDVEFGVASIGYAVTIHNNKLSGCSQGAISCASLEGDLLVTENKISRARAALVATSSHAFIQKNEVSI